VSRPKIAAAVIAATLLFGACANKDAKASDVEKVLKDAGATSAQAKECASKIDDALDQKQLNDLAGADHADDIPQKISDKINPILDQCLKGEGGTTATTTAGESTTSTTAG